MLSLEKRKHSNLLKHKLSTIYNTLAFEHTHIHINTSHTHIHTHTHTHASHTQFIHSFFRCYVCMCLYFCTRVVSVEASYSENVLTPDPPRGQEKGQIRETSEERQKLQSYVKKWFTNM